MNRALRAATMGALLLTPVVLTACSTGQVNQTSSQNRDKVGPEAEVGDLQLRQITVAHPCEGGDEDTIAYEEGDNAELIVTIVNTGREDDTLVGIEGDLFDGVYVGEVPGEATAATTPAAPTTGTETPGTAGAPATPTSATPTSATSTSDPDITVPARSTVTIGLRQYEEGSPCDPRIEADTPRLFLADLDTDEPLTPGQTIPLTLTFEDAGEVTVPALVSGPGAVLPRGEGFDFHHEDEAEADNEVAGGGNPESNDPQD